MKQLRVKMSDDQHGRLASASRKSGLAMSTIISNGIDGELGEMADDLNGGKPWRHARAKIGRPRKVAKP